MICLNECPNWSIVPRGASFVVVLLTDLTTLPSASRSAKDRSRIEWYALDLCGITATGETLRCCGWLALMSSQRTTRACPFATLSATSSAKCLMASGSRADLCGPWSIAVYISVRVQSRPAAVGKPKCSHLHRMSAALCLSASPCGAISRSADVFVLWFQCSWDSNVSLV